MRSPYTSSFKRLPDDADVTLHTEYLVLTREWLSQPSFEVDVEKISLKTEKFWRVYRICAKEYSHEAASFFMRFHARLTANPVKMIPFWPLTTKFPYEIVHENPNLYFFIEGEEIQPNIYPKDSAKCLVGSSKDEHYRLTALKTSGKRLLVSAGRYTVLKFTFIEQGTLVRYGSKPTLNLLVRTIDGDLIEEDELTQAPPNHEIKIRADYRLTAEIRHRGHVTDRFPIKPEDSIKHIPEGSELYFFLGTECVRHIRFGHPRTEVAPKLHTDFLLPKSGTMTLSAGLKLLSGMKFRSRVEFKSAIREGNLKIH